MAELIATFNKDGFEFKAELGMTSANFLDNNLTLRLQMLINGKVVDAKWESYKEKLLDSTDFVANKLVEWSLLMIEKYKDNEK